jgi:hypothetical protein
LPLKPFLAHTTSASSQGLDPHSQQPPFHTKPALPLMWIPLC